MRRVICAILAVVLLASALPFATADEAPAMTMSEDGVQFLKTLEGFTAFRYWDHTQYSIGYGTAIKSEEYPSGITRDEADALLRRTLDTLGEKLQAFLTKHNIAVSQNQYDALLSFTYNIGIGWLSGCRLSRLLIAGNFTEAELASAMGVWCHSGGKVHYGLLTRRIREAKIFLYGDYEGKTSRQYRYLVFNGGGGTAETDIGLYPQGEPYGKLPTATRSGRYFAGWKLGDGTEITEKTVVSQSGTATAQWATQEPVHRVFSDVPQSAWYYTYVDELYNDKLIAGYSDGKFRPNTSVRTGEAMKLILLACGEKEQPAGEAHWADGYRALVLERALVPEAELPDSEACVSRLTVAKLLANLLELKPAASGAYTDTQEDAAQALYEAGVMQGEGEDGSRHFHPQAAVSRAELCAILYRVRNR